MTPDARTELLELLSALCDEGLDDPGRARLERLLAADPESRRLYLEYVDLHAHLLGQPAELAPVAEPAAARPAPAKSGRAHLGRYALVAAGTLAFSLLIQFTAFGLFRGAPENHGGGPAAAPAAGYLATLTQTAACVWDDPARPLAVGSRLAAGELRLKAGTARVRFDAGPTLTLEAPARVRIESAGAATVLGGKVVFRDEGSDVAFDLRTPRSTFVDFGTEYAVAVTPEGEEVHVFDGEVRRTAQADAAAPPQTLAAGQARRYGADPRDPGRPTPLAPERFVRQVAAPAPPAGPDTTLLAYEGFNYPDPEALWRGVANDGVGWTTPWTAGFARPLNPGDMNRNALNPVGGLTRPGVAAAGGCFEYTGFTRYLRRLPAPVRMDADAVYYLSYLFRRDGPPADPLNAVAVLLRTSEDLDRDLAGGGQDPAARFNVGLDQTNTLFTYLNRVGGRTPLPLSDGATYLLVAKIAASASAPDQVFVRVYAAAEPVDREEPGMWSVVGPPVDSRLVFDWLQIHINSRTRQAIDEVRVGTTWAAVTAAWAAPGPPKAP